MDKNKIIDSLATLIDSLEIDFPDNADEKLCYLVSTMAKSWWGQTIHTDYNKHTFFNSTNKRALVRNLIYRTTTRYCIYEIYPQCLMYVKEDEINDPVQLTENTRRDSLPDEVKNLDTSLINTFGLYLPKMLWGNVITKKIQLISNIHLALPSLFCFGYDDTIIFPSEKHESFLSIPYWFGRTILNMSTATVMKAYNSGDIFYIGNGIIGFILLQKQKKFIKLD